MAIRTCVGCLVSALFGEKPLIRISKKRVRRIFERAKICKNARGAFSNVLGPGAAEPLTGRSGTASREQRSLERACARERGPAWLRAAQRPGAAGAATERSQRSCDMRSMRAAPRRSRAGAQAVLTHGFVSNPITRQCNGFVINNPQFGPVA